MACEVAPTIFRNKLSWCSHLRNTGTTVLVYSTAQSIYQYMFVFVWIVCNEMILPFTHNAFQLHVVLIVL